ncbi:MAG: pantoate--beta-alanine ligase [Candidatus Eisenbacteria bacterium]|nr:pantoate--beta-alanine ligase [Candidatus Eisenbacteria bacterium]
MKRITSVEEMRGEAATLRKAGQVVGLVPTMGYLHEGHLSLIRLARELSDSVVVSVFVNPTQFGPSEDYERYPRDLARDADLAEEAGCDVLFVPGASEMYPDGHATVVHVKGLTDKLCGAFRPGHFDGVCTVVAKLLNIVRPDLAVFGQKDGQQAAVIRRMAADLDMDVSIEIGETVREADGLAMSSRNSYLSPAERADALAISGALTEAKVRYEAGETDPAAVLDGVRSAIEERPSATVQYAAAVDRFTLEDVGVLGPGTMIAVAVRVGGTRLIDNIVL